jgi:hypothetical protein
MDTVHTIDIKLAAILATEGIPQRFQDPITCTIEIQPDGRNFKQFRFWFDVSAPGDRQKAETLINSFYAIRKDLEASIKDAKAGGAKTVNFPDDDMTKMISCQMWRDVYLHWIKNHVEPMRTVTIDGRHVTLSVNASRETKNKIRQALK